MKLSNSNLESEIGSRVLNEDQTRQSNVESPPGDPGRVLGSRDTLGTTSPYTDATAVTSGSRLGAVSPPAHAGAGTAALPPPTDQPFSAFGSISQFKDAQRMATMLTHSTIVPENYRGDEHLGDCVIALEIANRIGASILAVMQNLRFVEGKLGWSSQFLISCVNASRRFSPIRYQMIGTRGEDNWGCIAWAIDNAGEVLKSPEVTIKVAKEEGWYYRAGSKWKTMPELMLCYRSATLFTRLYAPEITMGIQTTEESVEMGSEGNGQPSRPVFAAGSPKPNSTKPEAKEAVSTASSGRAAPFQGEENDGPSGSQPASGEGPVPPQGEPLSNPQSAHYHYLKALTGLISLTRHSEDEVVKFLYHTHRCAESSTGLARIAQQQPELIVWLHDNWKSVERELARRKKEKTV